MAGRITGKKDPRNLKLSNKLSNEVLQESQSDYSPKPPQKISLSGILGLNQKVELNKPVEKKNEIFSNINHLQQEQNILFSHKNQELKRTLEELRDEIGKLASVTNNLENDVKNIAVAEISDVSEYQVTFLNRIKNFISNLRKNISEACNWVEAFAAKKKKKNAFWTKANNKKKGGTQYMFSDEHSAARSVN